jgi:hypothetical protein
MVAEAAANPIPNADLRSILFIALLLRLRNEPWQKRRAHFVGCEWWCETEKRVGLRESVPADGTSAARLPERRFRHVPLQGQLHYM